MSQSSSLYLSSSSLLVVILSLLTQHSVHTQRTASIAALWDQSPCYSSHTWCRYSVLLKGSKAAECHAEPRRLAGSGGRVPRRAEEAYWQQQPSVTPTQADNETPLVSSLKGKRIAGVSCAQGCDAHFVCVRGVSPSEVHTNKTYHACATGERLDATELVVNQEV